MTQLILHTKMCISSHTLVRRCQTAVRFTGYSRTVDPQYGLCCLLQSFYQEFGCSIDICGKSVNPCTEATAQSHQLSD